MKRLEESLQVTLFDRSKKSPQLNQLGMALVPKAREVVNAYETMLYELTGDAELIGELKLGAVPSVIRALIPLSIQKLVDAYPKLNFRVTPGLTAPLLGLVEQGSIDAAIISSPISINSNLHWEKLAEEEMILLVSKEIKETDPLKLLKQMPYIRHTRRSSVGVLSDQWLNDNKISVDTSMELESLDAIYSMVAHQLGVSIVPNQCVSDPMMSVLKKIPLGDGGQPRVLGMLTRADCSKRNLVNQLRDQILRTVEEHKGD